MKALTDWQDGPPPFIGEWNASAMRDPEALRWWNGSQWSMRYDSDDPDEIKRELRRRPVEHLAYIEFRGLAECPANFVPPEPLGPL